MSAKFMIMVDSLITAGLQLGLEPEAVAAALAGRAYGLLRKKIGAPSARVYFDTALNSVPAEDVPGDR